MLDARIYRAALVPVLLAAIVCAFSLEDRPRPIRTTLAPDAFAARRAEQVLTALSATGGRRAGDAADAALARRIADAFRAIPGFEVSAPSFEGETIDGERTLTTVLARQVGAPGPGLVVVAHRDAAAPPAGAELSGTAAMLELARVVSGGRLRRTVTFASTSGGSGGVAGARDLARRLAGPVDAVLVLGDVAAARPRRPFVVGWSNGQGAAPLQLRRTVEEAVRIEAATDSGGASAITQWTRLAFPGTPGEQGALLQAQLPAVLLSASGERPPPADAPVDVGRLQAFGRAALRALIALDDGPTIARGAERDFVTSRKVIPAWAVRLMVGALLLPALLTAVDGLARVRRRRQAVKPGLVWIAAAGLPLAAAGLFASLLGLTGLVDAAPPVPVPKGAIPVDRAAGAALAATVLVLALGWIGLRPLALRALGDRAGLDGAGAGAALLVTWCALAVTVWALNPYAAAFLLPAAHLWLLIVAPEVALRRAAALALVAASLVPFAVAALVIATQWGLGPVDLAWLSFLAVAGGHVGPLAWALSSLGAGCALAALVLAWRARRPPAPPARPITVRGPVTYAGPGSLGGTESALRR